MLGEKVTTVTDPQRPDVVSVDGTMMLCEDLSIEPTQLEFLLLSHQLNSERMGEFSREGFVQGCMDLEADNIDKLKEQLHTKLLHDYENPDGFRKVYNYAFLFGRQTGQRSLGKDEPQPCYHPFIQFYTSIGSSHRIMEIIVKQQIQFIRAMDTVLTRKTQQNHFTRHMESRKSKTLVLSTHRLEKFLDFNNQVNMDLQNYDPEGAWPILIDEVIHLIFLSD